MSLQNYALLSEDLTGVVQAPGSFDSTVFAGWVAASNPKAIRYRPIVIPAQPAHDPAIQGVIQTGWIISATDVQPTLQIVTLDVVTQQQIAGEALFSALMATNVIAALNAAINNWATLTALQKDNIALLNAKILRALLRARFGVNN